jgi:hypothetical protein
MALLRAKKGLQVNHHCVENHPTIGKNWRSWDARTIDPEKRIVVPEIINAYISYTIDNTYSKPALLPSSIIVPSAES